MKPPAPTPQTALLKVSELHALENRLRSAARRAQQAGFTTRAASYHRQILAVRDERHRWSLLLNTPSPPIPTPHLIAALIAIVVPLVDVLIAGGVAAKRLTRLVFTIALLSYAVIVGTLPSPVCTPAPAQTEPPRHWVTKIARDELSRKSASPALPSNNFYPHAFRPAS